MKRPSVSSDLPLVEQLRKEKAQGEREIARLQRELDLVKGRSEGKIQQLEQNLERSNLSVDQMAAELDRVSKERDRLAQELSALQDSVIDQQSEISTLKHRQSLIDAELARKDKDAKQLLAAARRYKTRVDYLKSKLRRHRRASKSDEEDPSASVTGGASLDGSPHNASMMTGAGSSVLGGTNNGRRDSIQFPGYMTAEEEYFRLVVMAAKLNVSGTSTPTTIDDQESASQLIGEMDSTVIEDEVNDPEIDPKIMYERLQSEHIPFHKWHEWAQDYVMAHHMPCLMGVDNSMLSGEKKPRKQGFARRVVSGSKNKLKALAKLIPLGKSSKRKSIGIAAGGDGFE